MLPKQATAVAKAIKTIAKGMEIRPSVPIFAKNTVSKVPIFTKNAVSMMPIFVKKYGFKVPISAKVRIFA